MMKGRKFIGTMGAVLVALAMVGLLTWVFSQGQTIRWKDPISGNWSDPTKWDLGRVPTATDNVLIDAAGTYTVTLDVNATVASLTLGGASGTQTLDQNAYTLTLNGASTISTNGVYNLIGGTLTGSGSLTVNGTMNWSGGTVTGTGAFTVNSPLNISGTDVKYLDGRTITNKGTANWTGTGYVNMRNTAVFDNQAGATLDLQVDSDYGFWDGGRMGQGASTMGGH